MRIDQFQVFILDTDGNSTQNKNIGETTQIKQLHIKKHTNNVFVKV